MTKRVLVTLVSHSEEERERFGSCAAETPLWQALSSAGSLLLEPLPAGVAELPVREIRPQWTDAATLSPLTPVYLPFPTPDDRPEQGPVRSSAQPASSPPPERPAVLDLETATREAYSAHVNEIAAFLRADLSVLVMCEKAVVRYLSRHIVQIANHDPVVVEVSPDDDADAEGLALPMLPLPVPPSMRQREMAMLRDQMRALKNLQVLVIPHLDLLAGGSDAFAAPEVRELTELFYGKPDAVILAFADPSLTIPEVLAARFSRQIAIEGSDRLIVRSDGSLVPIERALVTQEEATRFTGIDDTDFYKHVVGLNPVRIRQAMRYAMLVHKGKPQATVDDLHDIIRVFKTHLATAFEIPKVTWKMIGGYDEVKQQLQEALWIMEQVRLLPDDDSRLRSSIVPRGFIFHGPPGTGKTLLAKAVANAMQGTIQVVSGPEVTSKWVGEGERKVRDLFAEARRNAPSVIVFDEFDSIAGRRSGMEDSASRGANAMVAQILTEMDGFRPEVPIIVIGTTNRLDIIDPALLRPSRFRSFHIPLPPDDARRQIIRVHAEDHHFEVPDDLIEAIVARTRGWNGDELRALFRDAYVAKWLRQVPADDPEDLADLLGTLVGKIGQANKEQHASRRGH